MFKDIGRLGWYPPLVEQFGIHKLCQAVLQRPLVQWRHGLEDLVGKLPPEDRPKLGHLFDRGQPVQPGHEGIL
jgi:hypothetical protein